MRCPRMQIGTPACQCWLELVSLIRVLEHAGMSCGPTTDWDHDYGCAPGFGGFDGLAFVRNRRLSTEPSIIVNRCGAPLSPETVAKRSSVPLPPRPPPLPPPLLSGVVHGSIRWDGMLL